MRALILATTFALSATSAFAELSAEEDCGYQADVVGAIQQARLDRVKEADLAEAIAATNPEWPEKYNKALTILAGPIYDVKRRDLKKIDLSEQWKTACLSK